MKIAELSGKKIAIVGLGKEGLANLKLLRKIDVGEIGLFDQKSAENLSEELQKFVKEWQAEGAKFSWFSGENYLNEIGKYQIIIKSPGVSPREKHLEEAVKNGAIMTSATRIFLANQKGKVIGVTGSKGKSTTATLIYLFLKKAGLNVDLIGNIGNTALDYLESDSAEKIYVFELSSYQLEDLEEERLEVGVLVSFFPDHLDYHDGLENYFQAKMKLAKAVTKNGLLIYNGANQKIADFIKNEQINVEEKVNFLPSDLENLLEESWEKNLEEIDLGDGLTLNRKKILLKGKHNLENIVAAIQTAQNFGVKNEVISEVLAEFKGLEHRLEEVGVFKGIKFIDDAISTTPESTMAAINSFKDEQIGTIFLGGLERGYKFEELAEKLAEKEIGNLILFPETGIKIKEAVDNQQNYQPNCFFVSTMQEAVEIAFEKTAEGQICLLSNASPSYNLFKNFEDKGNQFKELVKKLGNI